MRKALVEAAFTFFVLLGIVQSSSASCGLSTLYADAGTSKILTSPNYPASYNPSVKCSWKIESRYNSLNVKLKIVSFDTTGTSGACTNETDNLDVFDGDDLVARYCGSNVPRNLTISTGNYLKLIFTSPSNKAKQVFKLEYMAVQDSYCGSISS
ncbi:tumor necrosis factor-inducible gene 6 protein [Exaiptasia diaphana]|uniref:CUB domain-containing protein n=1 Tax=Exaiptasia diaphana TaxID=2652724 RepID=A0A913YUN7_EXADI|nr:tumor necrosis factor-inducible gene 6 protein [Exaiptasia diaphana]